MKFALIRCLQRGLNFLDYWLELAPCAGLAFQTNNEENELFLRQLEDDKYKRPLMCSFGSAV